MPAAPPTAYAPGTRLTVGSHQVAIEKYISEGGFAHVYTCKVDPPIPNRPLACLKRVAVPDKVYLNLLRAEVEAMQRLKGYPNVVQYYDSHAERMKNGIGYEVFLLMEYCEGGGLIDFMNTRLRDQLREHEVLKIMYDITLGLANMHMLNPPLIHRDLKIENVLLTGEGEYKLCDFGSVSPVLRVPKTPAEFKILDDDIKHHTTMQYRSPEMVDIYLGYPIDEKSDIWALGVFLYKVCYYTTPFERGGDAAILNAQYVIPQKPAYSDRLKNMIRVLLQPAPPQRPNIHQVMQEISSMRNVSNPLPPPGTVRTPSHVPQSLPVSQPVSQPGSQPASQPASQAVSQAGSQPGSQPDSAGIPSGPQPGLPARPQLSLQPPALLRPKPQLPPKPRTMEPRAHTGTYSTSSSSVDLSSRSAVLTRPKSMLLVPGAPQPPISRAVSPSPNLLASPNLSTSPSLGAFDSKFPNLSTLEAVSPAHTGHSDFDFSEDDVSSRYPTVRDLAGDPFANAPYPQTAPKLPPKPPVASKPGFSSGSQRSFGVPSGISTQIPAVAASSSGPASAGPGSAGPIAGPIAGAVSTGAGGSSDAVHSEPSRRPSDNAKAVREHAQAQITAARRSMESQRSVSPDSPLIIVDSAEIGGRFSPSPSVDGDEGDGTLSLQRTRSHTDGNEAGSEGKYASKLHRILTGLNEKSSTVVLENDRSHIDSNVDFLRSLQPTSSRSRHHQRSSSSKPSQGHSRSLSALFRTSSRRSQKSESDSEEDDQPTLRRGGSQFNNMVASDGSSGESDSARLSKRNSVSAGSFRPTNTIQQRVHAYLKGQQESTPPPRTARGYGRFTDEASHSDSELVDGTAESRRLHRGDRTITAPAVTENVPPAPPKATKPSLRPKAAYSQRQSVGY